MWTPELSMDIGEPVPRPPPTSPTSAVGQRVRAEREALERIYSRIQQSKQPWQKRHKIIDRSGRLSDEEE